MDDYEVHDYDRLESKVSMVGWLHANNRLTCRPVCSCCGGSQGIRRAWRKYNRHNEEMHFRPWQAETRGQKPRYKDHR